jgi:hypothetical protein
VFVSIIDISIRLVPKTISLHLSSAKLSIFALVASFFHSWMVFQDTTRLAFYWLINIRQPSSTLGVRSLIRNYPLVLKTLGLHSNGPCCTLSPTSNILWNPTSMTYLLIRLIDETTLVTCGAFFFDVGFTTSV